MPISAKDLVFNFVAGGVIVAGTGLIASRHSSKMGALFWSLPLTLLPIIIFFHYKKVPEEDVTGFVKNLIPSVLLLLLYIIVLWAALKSGGFWRALGLSGIALAVFVIIFWIIIKSNGKVRIK